MGDSIKDIMDSMDDLQQRLGRERCAAPREILLEEAKQLLLEGGQKDNFSRIDEIKSPKKKSQDVVYLESLISEADRVVAMLAGIN
jgi:hypothetical protein